jgi:hypothetical protein
MKVQATVVLVARGAAFLGAATAALLAGAAFAAYATDQATLGGLVLKSPSVNNAAHTRTAFCFVSGSVDGGPPTQPGGPPQPPVHVDPASCSAKQQRAALLCLHGRRITIKTPGPAAAVAGSISAMGHQNGFTATAIDNSRATWNATLALGGISTSRKRAASLEIEIDYGGGRSAWTAPLRIHGRSC